MSSDIWIELLIAGNGFAFFAFGIGQLLLKDKRAINYWSFTFFTYAGAVFLYTAAVHSIASLFSPGSIWWDFSIISMAGPLFFFYFFRLADPGYRFAWRDQWLFGPPILSILAALLVRPWKEARLNSIADILSGVAYLWVVFCCAFFLARLSRRTKAGPPANFRRLTFFIAIIYGVIVWAFAFYFLSRSGFGSGILAFVGTLLIMAVYFYHLRHPELLAASALSLPVRKGRSKITGLDLDATTKRLTQIMDERKLYLKDDLTLPELASQADLNPHQLSEILNQALGITFKTFVNRYRVAEARRILLEKPATPILEVALACGFRSKSAFNQLFQEEIGTTPTQYRQHITEGRRGG